MAKLTVYARALFELALEAENSPLEAYCAQAEEVLALTEAADEASAGSELMPVLKSPKITADEKVRLLESVFASVLAPDVMGFLCLIVRKGRAAELPEILRAFIEMAKEELGVAEARVYSATALSGEQTQRIVETLSRKLQKKVTVVTEVDPGLIGGLRVAVAGHEFDGTVKSQIGRMKDRMLGGNL